MTEQPPQESPNPLLVVLSGPSGVGKDAVLSRMRDLGLTYHFTVTATTRPRRANEKDGVDYIFLDSDEFQNMIDECRLMEWAEVYGNFYGVPKSQVVDALGCGRDVIIKADVQGAAAIQDMVPDAVCIFLAPPDMVELARRLKERMTESEGALKRRLETAELEMKRIDHFDHVVVNQQGRIDEAAYEIERIVAEERKRVPPRRVDL